MEGRREEESSGGGEMRRGERARRGEAGGEVRCSSTYRVELKHET